MTYDITRELANVELDPSRPATTRAPYAEAMIRKAVALAVGAGSVAWDDMTGTGVFHDDEARNIVDVTTAELVAHLGIGRAHLGHASTAELASELASRGPWSRADYRTTGPDDAPWEFEPHEQQAMLVAEVVRVATLTADNVRLVARGSGRSTAIRAAGIALLHLAEQDA